MSNQTETAYLPEVGDTVRKTFTRYGAGPSRIHIEGRVTEIGPMPGMGLPAIKVKESPDEHYPHGYEGYWYAEGWEKVA